MTKVKNTAKYKIKITKNGPYLVSGGVPLSGQTMCLDSEGRSGNMPFCDGSHGKANFDGKETASRLPYLIQAGEIDGPGVKLTDVQNLCASARFCHRGGGTWKLAHQSDNPEARKMMIEEVADCPSGRLAAWDKDGKPIEPDFEPSIGVVEDVQAGKMGPLWVRGGIPIEAEDGTTYETRNRVTLCRCGKSLNKPFCDSRHLK
jgi:CDGSH-type Zn-finger protein